MAAYLKLFILVSLQNSGGYTQLDYFGSTNRLSISSAGTYNYSVNSFSNSFSSTSGRTMTYDPTKFTNSLGGAIFPSGIAITNFAVSDTFSFVVTADNVTNGDEVGVAGVAVYRNAIYINDIKTYLSDLESQNMVGSQVEVSVTKGIFPTGKRIYNSCGNILVNADATTFTDLNDANFTDAYTTTNIRVGTSGVYEVINPNGIIQSILRYHLEYGYSTGTFPTSYKNNTTNTLPQRGLVLMQGGGGGGGGASPWTTTHYAGGAGGGSGAWALVKINDISEWSSISVTSGGTGGAIGIGDAASPGATGGYSRIGVSITGTTYYITCDGGGGGATGAIVASRNNGGAGGTYSKSAFIADSKAFKIWALEGNSLSGAGGQSYGFGAALDWAPSAAPYTDLNTYYGIQYNSSAQATDVYSGAADHYTLWPVELGGDGVTWVSGTMYGDVNEGAGGTGAASPYGMGGDSIFDGENTNGNGDSFGAGGGGSSSRFWEGDRLPGGNGQDGFINVYY